MSSQFFLFSGFWCRLLGTPNEQVWPGVSKLMNWHEYPQWSPQNLSTSVPNLDKDGLDLLAVSWLLIIWRCLHLKCLFLWWLTLAWHVFLQQMLQYEPSKRISAKKAMEHPYFDDLNKDSLWTELCEWEILFWLVTEVL